MLSRSITFQIYVPEHCLLSGFLNRQEPCVLIDQSLEVNILELSDPKSGFSLLVISVDCLSLDVQIISKIRELYPKCQLVLSSHTHYGPALDTNLDRLGEIDVNFLGVFYDQMEKNLQELKSQHFVETRLQLKELKTQCVIKRRIYVNLKPFYFSVNAARIENEMYNGFCFELRDTNDKLLSVFWSYPCHPVSFPSKCQMSAHYVGTVRQRIRQKFGDETTVVFAQGASGNLRPPSFSDDGSLKAKFNRVLKAFRLQLFTNFNASDYLEFITKVNDDFDKAKICVSDVDTLSFGTAEIYLSDLGNFEKEKQLEVQVLNIGSEYQIVFLPGEPVNEWVEVVSKNSLNIKRFVCGYTGNVFGYLPTQQLVKFGGYEVNGFQPFFNLKGEWGKQIDERVLSAVTRATLDSK